MDHVPDVCISSFLSNLSISFFDWLITTKQKKLATVIRNFNQTISLCVKIASPTQKFAIFLSLEDYCKHSIYDFRLLVPSEMRAELVDFLKQNKTVETLPDPPSAIAGQQCADVDVFCKAITTKILGRRKKVEIVFVDRKEKKPFKRLRREASGTNPILVASPFIRQAVENGTKCVQLGLDLLQCALMQKNQGLEDTEAIALQQQLETFSNSILELRSKVPQS